MNVSDYLKTAPQDVADSVAWIVQCQCPENNDLQVLNIWRGGNDEGPPLNLLCEFEDASYSVYVISKRSFTMSWTKDEMDNVDIEPFPANYGVIKGWKRHIQKPNTLIWTFNKPNSSCCVTEESKQCSCDLDTLMIHGCQCGGK